MTDTSSKTGPRQPPLLSRRAGVIRTLGLDIVGPLALYYLCRNASVPEVWALVVAGSLPVLGVVVDWLRWRKLEVLGAVVLGGCVVGIGMALLTESAKVMLLEGNVLTAVVGVVFLVSLRWRRPVYFYMIQAFYGGRHSVDGAAMEGDFDRSSEARFVWRRLNAVWGVATLLQAGGSALVALNAPTGTALTISTAAEWLIPAALLAWAYLWVGSPVARHEPAQGVLGLDLSDSEESPTQPDDSRSQGRRSDA